MIEDIANEFEKMISAGTMSFHEVDVRTLDKWGQMLVNEFLGKHNIKWLLGDKKVGNAYCLKLSDPLLHYMDVYPDTRQFMWCIDNHRDSMKPDDVLVYLLNKYIQSRSILRN